MATNTDERSIGDLLQVVVRDMGDMVRAEIRLARAELEQSARNAGKAGGMLGGAAMAGLLAAACLVTTGIAAMALVMSLWLASLLMTVFLAVVGGALYAGGRAKLREVKPTPEKTVETVKENIEWAKHQMR
jgi:hypothetical protein